MLLFCQINLSVGYFFKGITVENIRAVIVYYFCNCVVSKNLKRNTKNCKFSPSLKWSQKAKSEQWHILQQCHDNQRVQEQAEKKTLNSMQLPSSNPIFWHSRKVLQWVVTPVNLCLLLHPLYQLFNKEVVFRFQMLSCIYQIPLSKKWGCAC